MSNEEHDSRTVEEIGAQMALRSLPEPSASTEFRERLKAQFVSGAIPKAKGKIVSFPWYRRPVVLGLGIATAAAAAVILLVIGHQKPEWKLEGPMPREILVNGEIMSVEDPHEIADMLVAGNLIAAEDTTGATIVSTDNLVVQLTPCSEVMLPETPGRWFGRTVRAEVIRGEVRFGTGEKFRGAKLMVETEEAIVEVLGTTIAVIQEKFGTCVCVLEGSVKMGPRDGPMSVVNAGRRRIIYNDERPPFEEPILPMEQMKLEMMRDSYCVPAE
jgi:ferric-dicitrate binding protein FerR (iron transport regulator)